MNPKTIVMVFVLQSFIAFLFFCESFFPTITRQGFRSSVGVFPLRIYPSGFFSFAKATVFHHHRRMVKFVINFSKTRCKLQSQIWDPGTLSIGLEDGVINFQTYCITNNRLLFFSTVMESTPRLAPIGSYDWLTFLSNLRKGEQFWICYPEKYNCDFIVCGKESWMLSFDNSRIAMSPFICMDRHFFWMESKSIKTDWIELWMHQVDYRYSVSSRLHVDVGNFWQHNLTDLDWTWWIWKVSTTFRMGFIENIGFGRRFRHDLQSFSYIVLSFKRQDVKSLHATLQFFLLNKVMRKAFWSFIYKMIANYEYVKASDRQHGHFHSFSKIVFQFLYLCQWL